MITVMTVLAIVLICLAGNIRMLYSLDRESPELNATLARWYWLRRLWVDSERDGERKPDPTTGPVPRAPGRYRHVVGRRRLVPGPESTKLG